MSNNTEEKKADLYADKIIDDVKWVSRVNGEDPYIYCDSREPSYDIRHLENTCLSMLNRF